MELDPQNDTLSLAGSRCVLVKYSHLRNHYVLDMRDFNPHRVFLDDEWMAEILLDSDLQSESIHFRCIASPTQELPAPCDDTHLRV
jgi:hypothetical protein